MNSIIGLVVRVALAFGPPIVHCKWLFEGQAKLGYDIDTSEAHQITAQTNLTFVEHFRCPVEFVGPQTGDDQLPPQSQDVPTEHRRDNRDSFVTQQLQVSNRLLGSQSCYSNLPAKLRLATDPLQAVDDLRFERYVPNRDSSLLRSSYYWLRPILAASIRKAIQRTVFQRRCRSKFPNWPLDCSVEKILECLMQFTIRTGGAAEIPFIWFWPEGHHSALIMTHDVEEEFGAMHCRMLMDLDASFGINGSFQVVPEGRYDGVAELIAEIRERGFEVNLHDLDHDGRLYQDLEGFREKATKINNYARQYKTKGFRAGSMHRNLEWLHFLNFEYDMSVPNVAHLEPQHGGCCTLMPYFVGDVLELPLTTVQDHGLFFVLKEHSIDLWRQQIEDICAHHGLISFIVHPDYVVSGSERKLYCELLEHIAKMRADRQIWITRPEEVNTWWRQRNQMKLVKTETGWQVEGQGSCRARIAYALIADGKLKYRISTTQFKSKMPEEKLRDRAGVSIE